MQVRGTEETQLGTFGVSSRNSFQSINEVYIGACGVFRIHIYIYIYTVYIYIYIFLFMNIIYIHIYISRGMENTILQKHQPQLRGSNLCDQWKLYIYIFTSVDDTRVDT